tara:strand:- start:2149 stop:2418 length:270 start_codon:yes stop_codon:yes gene_type:complete
MKDLIKEICPTEGILKKVQFESGNDFYLTIDLVDEELDVFSSSFVDDDCINVDVSDLTYLILNEKNLKNMLKALKKSQQLFAKEFNNDK